MVTEKLTEEHLNREEIKIAIYSDWWYPDSIGGAENSARNTLMKFSNHFPENFQFHVFTIRNRSQEKYLMNDRHYLHRVKMLTFRRKAEVTLSIKILERIRLTLDIISPFIIAKKIISYQPKIIVVHNLDRCGPMLIHFLKKLSPESKIIRVFHDAGDTCEKRSRFFLGKVCQTTCKLCIPRLKIHKLIMKNVDTSIFVSQYLQNKLIGLGFKSHNFKVGYPLNSIKQKLEFDDNLAFNRDKIVIGYLGRISREKGISVLVEALTLLGKTKKVSLIIYGNGSKAYKDNILRKLNFNQIEVQFNSASSEALQKLKNCVDVIVVPSLWEEPFGKVPFEAISKVRVPVISSNSGGLVESSKFIKNNLHFFKSGDSSDLAETIKKLKVTREEEICINEEDTLDFQMKRSLEMYLNY